jgi:AcrR family transcriptional regulator
MAKQAQRKVRLVEADLDTRARLLAAAKDEFIAHGLRAAKIAAICRRAELANGTFYLHFRTKDEVCRVLLEEAARELAGRLVTGRPAHLDARARDRLEISIIVDFAEERQDLFKLMSDERPSYSIAHKAFFSTLNEQRRAAIAAGQKAGEFRKELDPMLAALADFGVTIEIIQWWMANRKKHTKAYMIEKLADLRARMFFPGV